MNEALLQMGERHIAQIKRQEEIIEELERDGHRRTAETARGLLMTSRIACGWLGSKLNY
jgi:hypothetical protein